MTFQRFVWFTSIHEYGPVRGNGLFRVPGVSACLLVSVFVLTACGQEREVQKQAKGVNWNEPVTAATGRGRRGPWRMNDSDFRYVDDPSADVMDDGTVGLAWVDQADQNIRFQVYGPDGTTTFDDPVNVSRTPGVFSWFPKLIMTDDDPRHVYVLWQEIVFSGGSHGGEAYFAYSTDGGRTFEGPINLSNSTAGDGKGRLTEERWDNGSLDLVTGPEGTLYAAWTEYQGRLWVRKSTDGGASWSDPLLVAGGRREHGPARGPSLAVVSPSTLCVAWTVGERDDADVRVARLDTAPLSVEQRTVARNTGGHSDAPKIAVDGDGTVHLVWGESPEGMLHSYHVLYSHALVDEFDFDEPVNVSSPQSEHFASVNYPALQIDENGGLYVVWDVFASATPRPDDLGATYSGDGGETFVKPHVIPGTKAPSGGFNGSGQGLLMGKLSVSPNGRVCVVNSNFVRGESSEVYFITGR